MADMPCETSNSSEHETIKLDDMIESTGCSSLTDSLVNFAVVDFGTCLECDDDVVPAHGKELIALIVISCLLIFFWILFLPIIALFMIPTPYKASNAGMPTSKALIPITKVRDTTELLESILKHLPPIDIVRATRVNKKFHDLIHNSVTLQRASLMLPPKDKKSFRYCEMRLSGPYLLQQSLRPLPTTNGALTNYSPPVDKPTDMPVQAIKLMRSKPLQISSLSPFLELDHDETSWATIPRTTTLTFTSNTIWTPAHISPRGQKAFFTSPSVHMQLSNPPPKHAHIKLYWECRVNNLLTKVLIASRHVHCSQGITFHALINSASSTPGTIVVSTPTYDPQDQARVTSWTNTRVRHLTLYELAKFSSNPAEREWSLGTQSRVMLEGVVVPATQRELARLRDVRQREAEPVLRWYRFE